jgi:HEPN domain-containing protein
MKKIEHIEYWIKTAEHDLDTAKGLLDIKHYDWCLFICHLVLEKILKAHYVNNTGDVPPKLHDLIRLAEKAELILNEEQYRILERANYFNMSARYPDEKLKFYQICTKEYTVSNFNEIINLYQWLKSNLKY